MECPNCGRQTPDALLVCRYCGIAPRPPLWRRVVDWFRGVRARVPRVSVSFDTSADPHARPLSADEEPLGIEMPAGAKTKTVTMGVTTVTTSRRDGAALETLPEDIRDALRRAAGSGGMVYYERVVQDDGSGPVVSQRGTPPDPQLRAALEKLLQAEAGATEQQIVVEVNGDRQVYRSAEEMPPEVRKMLGRFADLPLTPDAGET